MKNFTAFARIAIIEKLNRDFGFKLDVKSGDFMQGKRTDLMNPETRKRKLPALRKQAERARENIARRKNPPAAWVFLSTKFTD